MFSGQTSFLILFYIADILLKIHSSVFTYLMLKIHKNILFSLNVIGCLVDQNEYNSDHSNKKL